MERNVTALRTMFGVDDDGRDIVVAFTAQLKYLTRSAAAAVQCMSQPAQRNHILAKFLA